MSQISAGLLVFRRRAQGPEFLLAHPGGPFWSGRDEGAWTIPKGLLAPGEPPLEGALREFREETGLTAPGPFLPLTPQPQRGGKQVMAWLAKADLDLSTFRSEPFEMEWPPRSGRRQRFPEIDAVDYLPVDRARIRLLPGQRPFLDEALALIRSAS